MPPFLIHLKFFLIFALCFLVGSFIWDIDHFFKCNNKALLKTVFHAKEGYAELEESNPEGCRGFFHSYEFIVGFIALALAFVMHMVLDHISVLNEI